MPSDNQKNLSEVQTVLQAMLARQCNGVPLLSDEASKYLAAKMHEAHQEHLVQARAA